MHLLAYWIFGLDQVLHEVSHIVKQLVLDVEPLFTLLDDELFEIVICVYLRHTIAYLVNVTFFLCVDRAPIKAAAAFLASFIHLGLLLKLASVHGSDEATLDDLG